MEQINEVSLGTLAKVGVGILALKQLAKLFKLQRAPNYQRSATLDYARQLTNSKTDEEAMIAVVGLLNVAATVLLRIDKLRFLGQKVMEVVKSDTLRQFIESRK